MGNRYVDLYTLCLQSAGEDAHCECARGCAFGKHYTLAIVTAFFHEDVQAFKFQAASFQAREASVFTNLSLHLRFVQGWIDNADPS